MREPSKVTKVLIKRIHGGRKQDSKFWQSEFSDETISKPKKSQPDVVGFFLYPLILLALFISGYGSYYIYTRFFVSSDTSVSHETVYSQPVSSSEPIYSPPVFKQPSKSRPQKQTHFIKPKDRPVTKRELDRAINKALRQPSTNNRSAHSVFELPYYRVELTSGSVIKAKSASQDGTHYTIKDIHGLEFSMLRSDIKSVKKIFPE